MPEKYLVWIAAAILGIVFLFGMVRNVAEVPSDLFDHNHPQWAGLLAHFVESGWVDYSGLKQEERKLDEYLHELQSVSKTHYRHWTPPQQLSYWINAYNAYTLKLILDHHPITSIRKIGWLPGAPFKKTFIPIHFWNGGNLSLNNIEHDILREEFKEPRIHFAIVCASESCPALQPRAYIASNLEEQLDSSTRAFINDPSKNRYDGKENTLRLSAMFDWFESDFKTGTLGLVDFVIRYADSDLAEMLQRNPEPKVRFLKYDWSLNGK